MNLFTKKQPDSAVTYPVRKKGNVPIDESFYLNQVLNLCSRKDLVKRADEIASCSNNPLLIPQAPIQAKIQLNRERLDNCSLYKIIDICNLRPMHKNGRLYMDRIDSWKDPYENYLKRSHHISSDGYLLADHKIADIFGQSWSLKEESDMMWRIYSHRGDQNPIVRNYGWDSDMLCYTGVRLKVNAKRLLECCYGAEGLRLWMGKVAYGRSRALLQAELQQAIDSGSGTDELLCKSYFYKQALFAYEEEFRVICSFSDKDFEKNGHHAQRIAFPVVMSDLVEEYTLDPRLDLGGELFMNTLLAKMGVEKSKIRKSKLYSYYPFTLQWD